MTFDLWTVGMQAINFIVLVWLLQRFLFKPVSAAIARRQQAVDARFKAAAEAQARANEAAEDARRKRAEIEDSRTELHAAARAEAAEERRQLMENARHEAETLLKEERARISRERAEALTDLRRTAVDLAVDLSKSLLSKVKDDAVAEAMRTQALDALADLPREQLDSLREQIGPEHPLIIRTAQGLTQSDETGWRARLAELMGKEIPVLFEADDSLIAGVEIRAPGTIIGFSWRNTLDQLREDWTGNA